MEEGQLLSKGQEEGEGGCFLMGLSTQVPFVAGFQARSQGGLNTPPVPSLPRAALCPGNFSNLSRPRGWESQLNYKRQKEETFPARCGCDASQEPEGVGREGERCPSADHPLSPFFSCNRSWDSLLVKSVRPLPWSTRTRACISGRALTHSHTHANAWPSPGRQLCRALPAALGFLL